MPAALASAPLAAQVRPQPGAGDPRIQTVEYDPNQVVQIQAAPGYQVTLEFGSDEQIENVAVGDSGAWQVTANRSGGHLFVKPLQGRHLDQHDGGHQLAHLRFRADAALRRRPDMAYTVRFRYPAPAGAAPAERRGWSPRAATG